MTPRPWGDGYIPSHELEPQKASVTLPKLAASVIYAQIPT